jgi:hypothetical protein
MQASAFNIRVIPISVVKRRFNSIHNILYTLFNTIAAYME